MPSLKTILTTGIVTLAGLFLLYSGGQEHSEAKSKRPTKTHEEPYKPEKRFRRPGLDLVARIEKPTEEWFNLATDDETRHFYLGCFDISPEEFRAQEEFNTENERLEICEERLDSYLKHLQTKGITRFLHETLDFNDYLGSGHLLNGLERLGGEFAVYSLLNMDNVEGLETDAENLALAKDLIYNDHLSIEDALNFYVPVFFSKPTEEGLEFILNLSSEEEGEQFLRTLLFSYNSELTNLALNSKINIPESLLDEFYGKSENKLSKIKALTKLGTGDATKKLVDIYRDSSLDERYLMISHVISLPESSLRHGFLSTSFLLAEDYDELMLLGEGLGRRIGYLLDEHGVLALPNMENYLYERATHEGEYVYYRVPTLAPAMDWDLGVEVETPGACLLMYDSMDLYCMVGDDVD